MIRAADAVAHIRRLGVPGYGDDEVGLIAKTVLKYRPDMVVDWGTNVGASARIFYEVALLAGIGCAVHTVELPDVYAHLDRDHPGHRYAQWLGRTLVTRHRGDGVTVAASLVEAHRPVRPLFFVDGGHATDNVLRELDIITSAAPQGVILVHDTGGTAGVAVDVFLAAGGDRLYRRDTLHSQAGLTRLWPKVQVLDA